ncbi:hypothetical protein E1212_07400 [Jiangella ureilytica]|uniref:Uncharacterized protein n=1 Tax=Jiangella ureilytica TaxID=2530374 RepID=A0A4R4RSF2_9ACTN|nr:hypothetical protein [Jiangella ureilytica]TDC52961.1 hypothetical protein E1212_07400 [Jiangella ureilytica]
MMSFLRRPVPVRRRRMRRRPPVGAGPGPDGARGVWELPSDELAQRARNLGVVLGLRRFA